MSTAEGTAYREKNEDDDDDNDDDRSSGENENDVDQASTLSNYDSDENQGDKDTDADQELNKIAAKVGGISLTSDQEEEDQERRRQQKLLLQQQENIDREDLLHEYENTPTLRTLARWIETGECSKILILSGAGVSCSAGIPDFRTPGTGLYDNLAKYNLPYPEAVFDINFYRRNTVPFVSLASEIWPGLRHSPTLTHSFVTLLDQKGLLLRNYTQNIDGLEILAGVSEERIVECHGHFRTASCVNCFAPYDGDKTKEEIVRNQRAPKCRRCKGPVKPDIVFFGQGLPDRFSRLLRRDLEEADLLLVMGTSLTVAPVSLIPTMVRDDCRRVLLNRELVGDFSPGPGQQRDIFAEGDIDDSVHEFCTIVGWEQELHVLNKKSRISTGSAGKSNVMTDE